MPVASRISEIDGICDMLDMSQIVIAASSREIHSLCVSRARDMAHCFDMADADKNGGPNHLRAWREYRKISQAQLAEMVGTNANMIGYLESGERSISLKWLRRLADALDTNVGMLAQFDPNDLDADMIEIWATSSNREKRKILEIARLVVSEEGEEMRDGTKG